MIRHRRGKNRRRRNTDRAYLQERFTTDQIAEAMLMAGIDGAKIYAFRKTGMILNEQDQQYVAPHRLAEWDAALAEYDARYGQITRGAGA
jgi:hypothetical protein